VFLSDGSSKTLQKTVCKTNCVEKLSQKNRPKIQNRYFLDFFSRVFWAFLGEGSSKHDKNYIEKINLSDLLNPIPFSYSDPPTHHGGNRVFFAGDSSGSGAAGGGGPQSKRVVEDLQAGSGVTRRPTPQVQ
jgi:hypothetical protein